MAKDGKFLIHIDPSKQHVPTEGPDKCQTCSVELEAAFGLAGGGYGVYMYCPQCGEIVSKTQVEY